jgi:hypothetical protein
MIRTAPLRLFGSGSRTIRLLPQSRLRWPLVRKVAVQLQVCGKIRAEPTAPEDLDQERKEADDGNDNSCEFWTHPRSVAE